ncbi:adenosine kinase [Commensalibacter nepenthis]|uniref:Adenosine kinase n=1 Tax=Commensalibacter nepenthis TaxID=3043872 RepID=A0ABT6Q8A6_9PROT|nr:adenosine kinase [Commensalibacter sp. TBRC 10068]MDI2113141.1 adenosine kinase [Commensalibacter sp. TBRC 10068]
MRSFREILGRKQTDDTEFDIVGIGNAIVDILVQVDSNFLEQHGMVPGTMALIDGHRAKELKSLVKPEKQMSGGSVANTCFVAALMGAKAAYLGKVADDSLGKNFAEDIRQGGVYFPSQPLKAKGNADLLTARSIIFVTPDGQRTMNTYLGACTQFKPKDVIEEVISAAKVTFLEGYLFDGELAQRAFYQAADMAHKAGKKVALSLSDAFCVQRHLAAFKDFVSTRVDMVFANEHEICALYETEDFEVAIVQAAKDAPIVVVTRGEKGSVIVAENERVEVACVPTVVVDTTGAGDAYVAGFLAGWTTDRTYAECGRLGSVVASEVISHFGARPLPELKEVMNF